MKIRQTLQKTSRPNTAPGMTDGELLAEVRRQLDTRPDTVDALAEHARTVLPDACLELMTRCLGGDVRCHAIVQRADFAGAWTVLNGTGPAGTYERVALALVILGEHAGRDLLGSDYGRRLLVEAGLATITDGEGA